MGFKSEIPLPLGVNFPMEELPEEEIMVLKNPVPLDLTDSFTDPCSKLNLQRGQCGTVLTRLQFEARIAAMDPRCLLLRRR